MEILGISPVWNDLFRSNLLVSWFEGFKASGEEVHGFGMAKSPEGMRRGNRL